MNITQSITGRLRSRTAQAEAVILRMAHLATEGHDATDAEAQTLADALELSADLFDRLGGDRDSRDKLKALGLAYPTNPDALVKFNWLVNTIRAKAEHERQAANLPRLERLAAEAATKHDTTRAEIIERHRREAAEIEKLHAQAHAASVRAGDSRKSRDAAATLAKLFPQLFTHEAQAGPTTQPQETPDHDDSSPSPTDPTT